MKVLIVTTCLIYVILFGLILYMHYDTKAILQNLPQPPIPQREVVSEEKIPSEVRTPFHQAEQTLEETLPVTHTHGDSHEQTDSHGHTHHHNSLVEPTPSLESDVAQHTEEPVEAPQVGGNCPLVWWHGKV